MGQWLTFYTQTVGKEFIGQLECLGENTEKYMTFSVPKEKQENGETIKYKIRFINSVRFTASFLSSLIDNPETTGWRTT